MDLRVLAAAANNARWCDLVCRSHGLPTVMSEELWFAPEGSPLFYPDAVTLAPGMTADAVLGAIDDRSGCSVKDSFADVDLGGRGFVVLFEARWLWREPARPESRPRIGWQAVATEDDFDQWARAAGVKDILRPSLMADSSVRVLLARGDPPAAAGAALNETNGVVGVSNVFAAGTNPGAVWADLPAVVAQIFGHSPLVGYEDGEALSSALANGFAATGALRIWMKPSA